MQVVKPSQNISLEQRFQVRELLEIVEWISRQIEGQLEAIDKFLEDRKSIVLFSFEKDKMIGYIIAQFYSWNRLSQIHGLIVHPHFRKKGFASLLINEVEGFMKGHDARGLYVDTPVNNIFGCAFYKKNNYR